MPYSYRTRRPQQRRGRGFTTTSKAKRHGRKEYIHPSKFVKAAKPVAVESYAPEHNFVDFAVHELLQGNIAARGFTSPSPIQDQAIPIGLAQRDVIGIANTGTGKTIAFALPVLHRLITEPNTKALIMAPTRELAQQIEDECRMVAKRSGLLGALLIGGTAMGPQLRDLRFNPRIIIGTPGRIKDHLERGSLKLDDCNIVVLDEVDRMLDMGFVADIRFLLDATSPERQSFFFSATMDNRVAGLIKDFSHEPITISVKTGDTSDNVEQDIVPYSSKSEKMDQLHNLLVKGDATKVLVFDETQRNVERLSEELMGRGFRVDAIHGGKSQGQRQRALNRFKSSDVTILVATDVAARGIDVSDITHVINYTTPQSYADYVHRIGRAGRAGRAGYAFTFVEA